MLLLLVALSVLFTTWLYIRYKRPAKFPPGPYNWPVIGNFFQLGLRPHLTFTEMRATYGDIMAIDLGTVRCVVLNDQKIIKEAFNLPALSGRMQSRHMAEPSSDLCKGVIFTEGNEWIEQRRFVLKNLRDFGFGKKSMEMLIQEEVAELIEGFREGAGKPIVTNKRFNVAVVNALWRIVTGERKDHKDPRFNKLVSHLTENMVDGTSAAILMFFPKLGDLFPQLSGFNKIRGNIVPIYDFIRETIGEHKATFQESNKRDLIDCYLEQIKSTTDSKSSFYKKTGDLNMANGVYDLFLAGAETTSTALTWTFLYLSHYPEVQEKLNREIQSVIGTRTPCLADKPNMPYCEAVIHEVLRSAVIVPLGAFHQAMEDVEFHGYKFPKGTVVIANQHCVLQDPKLWGDPENFRPERFLSKDEKTFVRQEAFIPFSVGKRVCLGESLARDEMFLFVTSLFQRFRVGFNTNAPIPPLDSHPSLLLIPLPHELVLHDRYES